MLNADMIPIDLLFTTAPMSDKQIETIPKDIVAQAATCTLVEYIVPTTSLFLLGTGLSTGGMADVLQLRTEIG
jgi:hypothetical protein